MPYKGTATGFMAVPRLIAIEGENVSRNMAYGPTEWFLAAKCGHEPVHETDKACLFASDREPVGDRYYFNQTWLRATECQECLEQYPLQLSAWEMLPRPPKQSGRKSSVFVIVCPACSKVFMAYEPVGTAPLWIEEEDDEEHDWLL